MKLRTLAVSVVVLAAAAGATTVAALDVVGLTHGSDAIVRGTVTSVQARLTKDGARIMTDAEVQVAETWKGSPVAGRSLTVMQPGGEVGDFGQRVEGVATFREGEEVVVFLEARGDRFIVTGMAQGKYRVERSSDGKAVFARSDGDVEVLDPVTRLPVPRAAQVLTLDQLRAQVRAAAAAPAPTPVGPTRPVAPTTVRP